MLASQWHFLVKNSFFMSSFFLKFRFIKGFDPTVSWSGLPAGSTVAFCGQNEQAVFDHVPNLVNSRAKVLTGYS